MKRTFIIAGFLALGVLPAISQTTVYDAIDGNTSGNFAGLASTAILDDTNLTSDFGLTSVDFQVENSNSASQLETVNLYIYDNSGGANSFTSGPGTQLFTASQSINLVAGSNLISFSLAGASINSTALWTGLMFSDPKGFTGMNLSNDVSVGTSANQYASGSGSTWTQKNFGSSPTANFAIRYEAQAAPEPSAIAIFALGLGVGVFAIRRMK